MPAAKHNRHGVKPGIESHAVAFYKAVEKSIAENKAYDERIKDRSYSGKYTEDERETFRMRRSYLRHKAEEAKVNLFQSIKDTLADRARYNDNQNTTSEDYSSTD